MGNDKSPQINPENPKSFLPNEYKSIVRADTGEVVSIVKKSYQIVRNADLIDNMLRQLATCGASFKIDSSHSFVDNNRMRLQVTFPELKLRDRESDIALSIFLHNSYNMEESVRFFFGAIRAVCSNGMVFGEVLSRYQSRHTTGFSLNNLREKLDEAGNHMGIIQERINRLENLPVTEVLVEQISDNVSKRLAEKVIKEEEVGRMTQWTLYNRLTNHVSHEMEPRMQARYQQAISKTFAL
ncbi:MAG: DUF932 domain-containing protein [Candidatus Babeliales bacterium]